MKQLFKSRNFGQALPLTFILPAMILLLAACSKKQEPAPQEEEVIEYLTFSGTLVDSIGKAPLRNIKAHISANYYEFTKRGPLSLDRNYVRYHDRTDSFYTDSSGGFTFRIDRRMLDKNGEAFVRFELSSGFMPLSLYKELISGMDSGGIINAHRASFLRVDLANFVDSKATTYLLQAWELGKSNPLAYTIEGMDKSIYYGHNYATFIHPILPGWYEFRSRSLIGNKEILRSVRREVRPWDTLLMSTIMK